MKYPGYKRCAKTSQRRTDVDRNFDLLQSTREDPFLKGRAILAGMGAWLGEKCRPTHASDKCLGLLEALGEFYPDARWQRCVVHWYRNVLRVVPRGKMADVAAMLKAIHSLEDRHAAESKARDVIEKLRTQKLTKASKVVEDGVSETLSYMQFPRQHWRHIRTNNPLERIMREIRRRTRVVGAFPDGKSALMLVAARLRHVSGTRWGTRRYLDMERLKQEEATRGAVA